MSTAVSSGQLPKLQHAKFENAETDEINVTYKSGAVFKGKVCDHRRIGSGKFVWPNGAQYEGQYQDNLRNGKGMLLYSHVHWILSSQCVERNTK